MSKARKKYKIGRFILKNRLVAPSAIGYTGKKEDSFGKGSCII
jgi:hypothetical protein